MTTAERAKQFLPFAALSGFEEALSKQEFVAEKRRFLGEDAQAELDSVLRQVEPGDTVKVEFYREWQYKVLTGLVKRLDPVRQTLFIGETAIQLADLHSIERL